MSQNSQNYNLEKFLNFKPKIYFTESAKQSASLFKRRAGNRIRILDYKLTIGMCHLM